jgi:hypothetical protein
MSANVYRQVRFHFGRRRRVGRQPGLEIQVAAAFAAVRHPAVHARRLEPLISAKDAAHHLAGGASAQHALNRVARS